MTNLWKINNIDIFSTYGTIIKRGSYLDILTPPTPRKRLEHDYTDADGTFVDTLSVLTHESRRFSIKILITASGYTEFWSRYNAFFSLIDQAAEFSLYIADLGVTCNLLYEGSRCVSKPRSLRSGKIAVEYDINVFEANPTNRTYL
jgi:hypothetical protein